jgi:Fe-S-cluster containining protein
MPEANPCLSCGACCALFKVVFNQTETDANQGGIVPAGYTVKINPTQCVMRGTERINKRCAALEGRVGQQVNCAIYDRRPSCCHGFRGAWEKDVVNPDCNRARATYGLQPFECY